MSKNARKVLYDCQHAIENYTDRLQAEDFRIAWMSIVALLRAVGHVLNTVDTKESIAMSKAIKKKWDDLCKTKPEPSIFWEFIVEERNRFLKNYEHSISRVGNLGWISDGSELVMSIDMTESQGFMIESSQMKINSFITSGKFKGMNERKLAWMACEWWENYLNEVDELSKQYSDKV